MLNASAKQRATLKKQHKSVSASAIKRDLRKMKVIPSLKLCDQCRWHNAVKTTTNSGRKSGNASREKLVSSLPKRVKIKSASISPPPLSQNQHKVEEITPENNKNLTATGKFP